MHPMATVPESMLALNAHSTTTIRIIIDVGDAVTIEEGDEVAEEAEEDN